jgi:hypothetical protein
VLVRGSGAPEPSIIGDVDEELSTSLHETTGEVWKDRLIADEHPKNPPGQSKVMDPFTGREITDGSDDISGEPENAGKGGVLPKGNKVDFIIPVQDFFLRRDQEGAIEIIYSGAIALKGWRAKKEGRPHLMR